MTRELQIGFPCFSLQRFEHYTPTAYPCWRGSFAVLDLVEWKGRTLHVLKDRNHASESSGNSAGTDFSR